MINQSTEQFFDTRASQRVKENKNIWWRIRDNGLEGRGRIRNLSTSGMLLETHSSLKPRDEHIFSLDSSLGMENFIPQTGRLVWSQKLRFGKSKYRCGIQFVEPSDYVRSKLRKRIDQAKKRIVVSRYVSNGLNGVLIAGTITLTGFILWTGSHIYQDMNVATDNLLSVSTDQATLSRDVSQRLGESQAALVLTQQQYEQSQVQLSQTQQMLSDTRKLYEESTLMITGVSAELEETKGILIETQGLLAQAKEQYAKLEGDTQSLKDINAQQLAQTKTELETNISSLEGQNSELSDRLNAVKYQLNYFEGNFNSLDEGRTLLSLYHSRIKLVKSKINEIKVQAKEARRKALIEMDKLKSALGNNGFLVKEGKIVKVDMEKYDSVRIPTVTGDSSPTSPKVEIDVTFVE